MEHSFYIHYSCFLFSVLSPGQSLYCIGLGNKSLVSQIVFPLPDIEMVVGGSRDSESPPAKKMTNING